ncbi:suppressor of fused domain protein, partial [Stieleria sp. ICT_E10.1]|uniref:suppressor of fused domain protein n=1 Tax=Stieleria sedimenti TaxID=2976331 RepID=UPI00217F5F53
SELDARDSELDARDSELDARGSELDARESELNARESELDARDSELGARSNGLDSRSHELDARANELERREQELEERTQKLDQRESELGQQQQEIQCLSQELDQRESDLAARIAETQQLESRLQAEQAALQQRSEEMNEREELLADREQATRPLEQSLEEQQLAAAKPDASAAPPATVSDDHPDVSAESILEEKKRLLQEFAERQASLSRREAELMRRENELTRRELDSVVTHDATTEPGWELEVESEPQRPVEPVAAGSDSTSGRASSWQDVLGRAEEQPADFELAEYDGVSAERVATAGKVAVAAEPEDDRSDIAAAQTGLSELRRLAYEERFGPCSRYDVDDDPSMRVDVSVHLPEDARDFTTLVTSGMSDYPIPMPNGQRSVRAELLLYVTHLDELAIQILRGAAKLPYRKKKGLSIGTTESLDELRDQLSGSQQKDCVYMLPVVESDSKPIPAKEVIGGVVQLFWLVTITEAERKLIDTGGIHKFLSLLEKNNHAVFFDLMRDCYVKRKGWFRR